MQLLEKEPLPADMYKIAASFIESGAGQHKFYGLLQKACEWAMLIPNLSKKAFTALQTSHGVVGAGDAATVLTKLPAQIQNFRVAIGNRSLAANNVTRYREKVVREGTDLVSDGMHLTQFMSIAKVLRLGKAALARVGYVASFAGVMIDSFDIKHAIEDIFASHKKEKIAATDNDKIIEKEKRKACYIDIARKIASLAVNILGLIALFLGFAIAGPIILLSLSTFSILGAFWKNFVEKGSRAERLRQTKIAQIPV